jgi:pyridoxal phosphate enzyme (YggS family)
VSGIAGNLEQVVQRIARAASLAGRGAECVKLVAVSKGHGAEAIREAYVAGHRRFGENYAQEFAAKVASLSDCRDIEWHFIGHIQSNKVKIVAPRAHVVHTIDSTSLAHDIGRRVARERGSLRVLVEVNVAGEPQKHGVSPSELRDVMAAIDVEPALLLCGLMTVPPADNLEKSRAAFETLGSLRSIHGGSSRLPELSMGMSQDFELAVASGATIVRVGSAIFGPRPPMPSA